MGLLTPMELNDQFNFSFLCLAAVQSPRVNDNVKGRVVSHIFQVKLCNSPHTYTCSLKTEYAS